MPSGLAYAVRRCLSREPQARRARSACRIFSIGRKQRFDAKAPTPGRCSPTTTQRNRQLSAKLPAGTTPGRPGRLDGTGPRGVEPG